MFKAVDIILGSGRDKENTEIALCALASEWVKSFGHAERKEVRRTSKAPDGRPMLTIEWSSDV